MRVEVPVRMRLELSRKGMFFGAMPIVLLMLPGCPAPVTDANAAPESPIAPINISLQQSGNRRLPPGGMSQVAADALGGFQLQGLTQIATAKRVKVEGQPFKEAFRLETTRRLPQIWDVQFSSGTTEAVKRGDTFLATFYMRTVKGQAETGEARTEFVFERGEDPYTKAVSYSVSIPARGWKRYDVPFKAVEDLPQNLGRIHFRMGYDPQIFEVGGFTLTKWGPEVALISLPRTSAYYAGMEENAPWRKAAEARIEKIRKADLQVTVVDGTGKVVPGANVAVRMQKHAFAFGSAVAADEILGTGPDSERYRAKIKELYNQVVMENDLKWSGWEENRQRAITGVKWLRDQGIEVRGHNLVWPAYRWLPRDIPSLKNDKAKLSKRISDHIVDIVGTMEGQLVDWDVINEPYANHDLMDILGKDAMVTWFKLAHQTDPKATLFLNDYPPLDGGDPNNPHLRDFYNNIQYLKAKGAPIGGIGFQGHFGGNVIPPTRLLSTLDQFGKFGLPIAITEFDINTQDEQLQARYMRDVLTATFSHPAVHSVIMWGFWEGRHWLPDAALYRRDWSIRPHGQVWLDLVKGNWWTNAAGVANSKGEYKIRGFMGDYEITVTAGKKRITRKGRLSKNGANFKVAL